MSKLVTLYKKQPPPLVLICMPFYRTMPKPAIMLHQCLQDTGIPGYRTITRDLETTIVVLARNDALQEIPGRHWDYLFFVDDDVGFPLKEMAEREVVRDRKGRQVSVARPIALMKRILDHQLDICGGLYCQGGDQYMPLVFRKFGHGDDETYVPILEPPQEGVEEIDALATGFLCFSRKVVEAFQKRMEERKAIRGAWLDWKRRAREQGTLEATMAALPQVLRDYLDISKPDIYPPFWLDYIHDPVRKEWRHMGEDVYFCREAQKLGFKIHVDWSVQLGHLRETYITPDAYRHAFMAEAVATQKEFFDKLQREQWEEADTAQRMGELGLTPVIEEVRASG